jgi:hypothetical protein
MPQVTLGTYVSSWLRSRNGASMDTAWNGSGMSANSGINLDTYAPVGAQGHDVNGSYWKACQNGGYVQLADLPNDAIIDNVAASFYLGSDDSDSDFYLYLMSYQFSSYSTSTWLNSTALQALEDESPTMRVGRLHTSSMSTGQFNDFTSISQDGFKQELELALANDETYWKYIYCSHDNLDLGGVNTNNNEIVQVYDLAENYHLKLVIDYHQPDPHAIMNGAIM